MIDYLSPMSKNSFLWMLCSWSILCSHAQTLNFPFVSTILSNGISARGNSLFAAADNHSCWWSHTIEYVETFTEGPAGVVTIQKWSGSGELLADFILSSNVVVFDVEPMHRVMLY